jgi:hypothetical protein
MDHSPDRANGSAGGLAARECAAIAADLDRLKALIAEAGDGLLASFNQVAAQLPGGFADAARRGAVNDAITAAVTALQFQDMATQLIQHAQRRLEVLEACLKSLAPEAEDPLLATTRSQPVRQTAMGAGSIDLF